MNRKKFLERLTDEDEEWDIIVIGGGATGMGIALDAATRGYKTALLEQADFAAGTSSKSTKLIHGGVRYLQGGDLPLVRESLRERGRLLKNSPNLVKPLAFIVPAYRWYERLYYGIGLRVYDFLAGKLGIASTGHLSKQQTLERVPNLHAEGLKGSTMYWDGQFDDSRLIIALARTAVANGAVIANYVGVDELIKRDGKVTGVRAVDQIGGREFNLKSKAVINATGVFSDAVRKLDEPESSDVILPSQGIHIVLDREFLGGNTGVMIPKTDDGRVLFAIPWHNRVLLGTTDTPGVPVSLHPKPLQEEIDYLIEHAARYLTKAPSHEDIRATFAGLRPLVKPAGPEGGASSKISRSHSIFVSDSSLLTIAGGKWTTYREMAEEAVDRLAGEDLLRTKPCCTSDLTLLDQSMARELAEADESLLEALDDELPYIMADVVAGVRFEMAMTLSDVLSRRTRSLLLDEKATVRCAEKVARWMAKELGEKEEWVQAQLKKFAAE